MKPVIYKLHPALVAKPKRRTSSIFRSTSTPFLQQGDLDGACGVYSVWLVMAIFGFATVSALMAGSVFKKPELKKAWRKSVEQFIVGIDEGDMNELLKSLRRFIQFEEVSASSYAVTHFALESLDKAALVLLGFETNSGSGHWMIAVGIEGQYDNARFQSTAILCIDCQEPAPVLAPFNVRVVVPIKQTRSKYTQYQSSSGESQIITLISAFAVTKRK